MKLEFSLTDFEKSNQTTNSIKVRPVAGEVFHADGQTDTKKQIISFNYAPRSVKVDKMLLNIPTLQAHSNIFIAIIRTYTRRTVSIRENKTAK